MSDNGIKKGLTKEKRDGTYKRPAHMTHEYMHSIKPDYIVETIKNFCDEYPLMFELYPDCRDRFLHELKGNRIKLRKFPEVIKAMYTDGREIPEDLRVEDNRH